jgi:hypothetical protein
MDVMAVIGKLAVHLDFYKLQESSRYEKEYSESTQISESVLRHFDLDGYRGSQNMQLFLKHFRTLYESEDFPPKVILGDHTPQLVPAQQLHIYTNIVQPVDMNDTATNLLKIVNVKGKPGMTTQEMFSNPTYQTVPKGGKISMIHVYIQSETGELVPFAGGRVLMELRFRRQRRRR